MIYVVSNQQRMFDDSFKCITVDESINMMKDWKIVQFDTETSKINPRIGKILAFQFGNDETDSRIVVDGTSINIELYKNILETKFIIGQNIKFDLQFLYHHNIRPMNLYDTMIAEQILCLGMPSFKEGGPAYNLLSIVSKRLSINMDKTARGEIIYRGLVNRVIEYAANDVTYLEKVMWSQVSEAKDKGCIDAIKMECSVIPAIAYMEYCGMYVNRQIFDDIIVDSKVKLEEAESELNNHVLEENNPLFTRDFQLSLFEDNDKPSCNIVWSNPQSVERYTKVNGIDGIKDMLSKFNHHLSITRDWKDLILKGIDLYDHRIHSDWWQVGTKSNRMISNHPSVQEIPTEIKKSICAETNNTLIYADYVCIQPRILGLLSNDEIIKMSFDNGGDPYSALARLLYNNEINEIKLKDVARLRPDLRDKAKIEFLKYIYGGNVYGKTEYDKLFKGIVKWKNSIHDYIKDKNKKTFKISPFGHIINIPDIIDDERMTYKIMSSINQCVESCCIKIAIKKLYDIILNNNNINQVKIVNCVFDSIVIEVPLYLSEYYFKALNDCMVSAFNEVLNANITIKCKQNDNWE